MGWGQFPRVNTREKERELRMLIKGTRRSEIFVVNHISSFNPFEREKGRGLCFLPQPLSLWRLEGVASLRKLCMMMMMMSIMAQWDPTGSHASASVHVCV